MFLFRYFEIVSRCLLEHRFQPSTSYCVPYWSMQFYGPYYMELRLDDLMAHYNFKIQEKGSSGSKGAWFPLDLYFEADWLLPKKTQNPIEGFLILCCALKKADSIFKLYLSGFKCGYGSASLLDWLESLALRRIPNKAFWPLISCRSGWTWPTESDAVRVGMDRHEHTHSHLLTERSLQ